MLLLHCIRKHSLRSSLLRLLLLWLLATHSLECVCHRIATVIHASVANRRKISMRVVVWRCVRH